MSGPGPGGPGDGGSGAAVPPLDPAAAEEIDTVDPAEQAPPPSPSAPPDTDVEAVPAPTTGDLAPSETLAAAVDAEPVPDASASEATPATEADAPEAVDEAAPTESVSPDPAPVEASASEPAPVEVSASEPAPVEVSASEPAPVEVSASEPARPETATPEPSPATAPPPAADAPAPTPKIGDAAPAEPSGPVAHPTVPKPRPVTETGRIVEGVVISVSADAVELTLDDGRTAVIHRRNFGLHDEEPSAIVSVGDRAFGAELLREDPKSRVVLSRAWALKRLAWEKVVEASEKNEALSGRVVSASGKGLVVDVGVRGFVPSSHLELTPVTDVASYVGQTLELRILEVDPRKEKLVLSRRSLLLRAQRKEMQELLHSLKKGEVRKGTVASLTDYGAFVDLGGVSGLVHISELSWQRVAKPGDVVKIGQEVEVKVLDVKPKKKRISLSLRQTGPDPLRALEVGAVVTGRVTRLVDFGAFVAIGDAEGLVHLSELAEYRVISPEEVVAPGDEVGVKILSVDPKRRRIELSIRRAAEYEG